jgi:hypothetical protein
MSKRKLCEAKAGSPHTIHRFSTALSLAISAAKSCAQGVKLARHSNGRAEDFMEFSQKRFQQAT